MDLSPLRALGEMLACSSKKRMMMTMAMVVTTMSMSMSMMTVVMVLMAMMLLMLTVLMLLTMMMMPTRVMMTITMVNDASVDAIDDNANDDANGGGPLGWGEQVLRQGQGGRNGPPPPRQTAPRSSPTLLPNKPRSSPPIQL